ncbi:LuxR C-terminal-related transcriptional regulator [Oceanobacillus kimchii]|uniref:LuxR C-terminal-related transcriptional regulator n=1 Tax=Oceanobacillus kimchii TaxID=746691 RepID=UPI00098563A6|nr:LuxR C-terminal-related transcriptional regulator [Oceanobacillus kimchii]
MIEVVYVSNGKEQKQYIHRLLERKAVQVLSWDRKITDCILSYSPDVAIFDVESLSYEELLEKMTIIKEMQPDIKIIFLVPTILEKEMYTMIDSQVDSILEKYQMKENELRQVINHLQHDYFYLPISVHKSLLERVQELKKTNFDIFYQKLTDNGIEISIKEAHVAYRVKEGLRNLNIASELGITEGTVKIHVSNLYRKLHIKGRRNMIEFLNNLKSDSFIDKENKEFNVIS